MPGKPRKETQGLSDEQIRRIAEIVNGQGDEETEEQETKVTVDESSVTFHGTIDQFREHFTLAGTDIPADAATSDSAGDTEDAEEQPAEPAPKRKGYRR
jgi:hypothetical protein